MIACTALGDDDNTSMWYPVYVGAPVSVKNTRCIVKSACKASTNKWNILVTFDNGGASKYVQNDELKLECDQNKGDLIYDGTIGDQLLKVVDDPNTNRNEITHLVQTLKNNGFEYGDAGHGTRFNEYGIAIEARDMKQH